MSSRLVSRSWADIKRPLDAIRAAAAQDAEYIVVGSGDESSVLTLIEQSLLSSPQMDLLVVFDPARPVRRPALRGLASALVSLIAGLPNEEDVAVALSVRRAIECSQRVDEMTSLAELALHISEGGSVAFVEHSVARSVPHRVPELTMPSAGPDTPWLRQFIERSLVPGQPSGGTEVVALRAGLYLLHDFFHESHSCSQSIEGLGQHQAGDYWHAILHRREPDYGNAKYWFRHVGRHPIFTDLAEHVTRHCFHTTGPLPTKLQRWKSRLVSNLGWDPFAFIDLCEAAQSDPDLRAWCEAVQYEEMLLLMASTWNDAVV